MKRVKRLLANKTLLTVPAEALQAVSQQFTVSVDPPGFIHHFIQLLILVFSCTKTSHITNTLSFKLESFYLRTGKHFYTVYMS